MKTTARKMSEGHNGDFLQRELLKTAATIYIGNVVGKKLNDFFVKDFADSFIKFTYGRKPK